MPDGDRDVMSSLPRSRPQRRSAKRDAPARKAAGDGGAKAAPRAKAVPRPKPKSAPKPRVKPKATPGRKIPASGYAVPEHSSPVAPGGAELVSGAVQALGELANLGGRALRGALSRLPKP